MKKIHRYRLSIFISLFALITFIHAPGWTARVAANAQTDAQYDLVIRNGRVLDGAGNPWIIADVAIDKGRFVKIGKIASRGRQEIDAKDRYVSPGWIDVMDQSGSVLPRNGLAENKLRMGVTTAIGGEGGTPVPAEKIPEYFAGLEKMKAIMETAMRGGAMGMTTALIYPPSSYAKTEELIEVAKAAAKYGGVYASHIRGEGKELVESVAEAIAIGERGGLPVEVFHLKAAYQPGWGTLVREVGKLVDQARARNVDVAADLYLYTAGGTGLEATIPSWAFEGGREE